MKQILISLIIFSCFLFNVNSVFAQFYFPDESEFSVEIDSEVYADATEDDATWAILNPTELASETRLEEIEEYHTASTNPFAGESFCWKESYGRGVGTIPTYCKNGMEKQAGLCYKKCASGFYGVGPVCWKYCPSGFRDDGAFCAKPAAYGRGAGYAAWDMWRCERRYGKGNCEWWGAVIYPKCKSGFYPAGCCVCSPVCPPGYYDIGVSCAKPSYGRGVGVPPTGCPGGKEYDAGLCYQHCKSGFEGVGPVCWQNTCPSPNGFTWQHCGMGCAENQSTCASSIIDMVVTPFQAIASIAGLVVTFGGSGAVSVSTQAGIKTFSKVVDVGSKVLSASQSVIESDLFLAFTQQNGRQPNASEAKGLKEYAATAFDVTKTYDISWKEFTALDPTGLSSVAAAYAYPICSEISSNSGPVSVYFHSQAGLSLSQANSIASQRGWKLASPQQVQAAWSSLGLHVYAFGRMSDGRFAVPVQSNFSNFSRGANIGATGGNQGFLYTK